MVSAGEVLDIAAQNQGDAELFGQRPDALAQRLALIGEGKLGALRRERFGYPPRNRMILGAAHYQTALTLHQVLHNYPVSHHTSGLLPRPALRGKRVGERGSSA